MAVNGLTGTLPSWIFELSSLGELSTDANAVDGTFVCRLTSSVAVLSLSSNFVSGSIPSEMGRLTNLTILNLHVNTFWGTIPTEMGLLTKLGE